MVRCQLYINNGVITASSRGGKLYNEAIPHIINNPDIINFFKNNPDVILDGELYIHGKTLQEISGIARTKKNIESKPKLEFHIYEMMSDENAFKRYMTLCKLSKEFEKCEYLKLHKQISIGSLAEALVLHDEFVANGYEGAVIKDVTGLYKEGYNQTMLKIKLMEDAEFEILGITEKKRDEDFVFRLKTVEGKEFEAKPTGETSERLKLKEDIDKLIGKMATVQYFGFTPGGVPNLPVFKCVRNYE